MKRATLYIAYHRIHNRWLDLRARLTGYCNADTWRADSPHGPGYSPGYSHWRCWKKRHPADQPHRFNNYVWFTGYPGHHDPLPVRNADNTGWYDSRGKGTPPPWGKHHATATRARSRARTRYAEQRRTALISKAAP